MPTSIDRLPRKLRQMDGTEKQTNVRTVIKATVDCQALYTAPLHPMDYHKMDQAKTKVLCRITGCQHKDTSATFLRTELGYLPTEYEADKRALGYLHHLHSRAWFKTELTGQDTPPLYGPGPYRRLLDLASKYSIDLVPKLDKLEWKAKVADKVRQTAATDANIRLREKGLPEVEPGHRPRPYIVLGGAKSRYGLQARWEMVRSTHRTLGTKGLQEGRGHRALCDTCHRRHHRKEDMPDLVDLIRCEALLPAHIQAYHRHVLALIRQDMHRSGSVDTSAPHIGLEKLEWPGQQATATRAACSLYKRLLRHRREQGREKGQGGEATGHGMVGR